FRTDRLRSLPARRALPHPRRPRARVLARTGLRHSGRCESARARRLPSSHPPHLRSRSEGDHFRGPRAANPGARDGAVKSRRPKGNGGSANDRPDGRTDQAGPLGRGRAGSDNGGGTRGIWSRAHRNEHSDDLFWESEAARLSEVEDEDEAAMRVLRGVRRVEISSRRFVQEIFGGEYHSTFRGQGIEFAEVREYVPGDDVRLIDRNVSARMQHPYVKIFHEERELSVIFLVDQSGSTRFGSAGKTRAEIAAELVAV